MSGQEGATTSRPTASLFLGAGWSRLAGRPLASELFDEAPFAPSAAAVRSYERVIRAWHSWAGTHPGQGPEQFLADISPEGARGLDPIWLDAVRFVGARLAEPDVVRLEHELRYGERITKPSPAPCHHEFLEQVLGQYNLAGVITTNFDLLAERTLRHRVMQRPRRPGFFYPGIDRPLRGSSAFSVRHGWVEVTGTIPLCKLHGSLNWALEGVALRAYADCRPAHRRSNISYVVPPQLEERPPPLLALPWETAEQLLNRTDHLLVVGYSAPPYDHAVEALLRNAGERISLVRVVDPNEGVAQRFAEIMGRDVVWEGPLTDEFVMAQMV